MMPEVAAVVCASLVRRHTPAMPSPASLSRHRTFRWNDGKDVERYEAVETRDDGLLWYRWSHLPHEGGRGDEALQGYDAFLRDGPLRDAPPRIVAALRAWIDEHG